MKKAYRNPVAVKVEFNYTENVNASTYGPWDKWMISNENYNCDSSYKEANGVCGYNGVHTSNPNHECTGH